MLVKDLLILFQAGNEGVINVLGLFIRPRVFFFSLKDIPEHYFEMSKIDAEQALSIYRHFCTQTERVVEYLGVAKKLQNLLNVPIPTLKHASKAFVCLSNHSQTPLGPCIIGGCTPGILE
jgi:hypothetical protein